MTRFPGSRTISAPSRLILIGVALLTALLVPASVLSTRSPVAQRKPVPSGKLAGTVLGPDGKPAAKARVMAQTSDGRSPRTTKTDAQGRFQLTCPAGPVDVRARTGEIWSEWVRNVRIRSGETTSITIHITEHPVPETKQTSTPSEPPH